MSDRWHSNMEIADNQHPIDLSPKCRYYDESRPCMKSTISSSRPLPDLIPIRILQDGATSSSPPSASASSGSPFSPSSNSSSPSPSAFASKRDRELFECFRSCNQSLMGLQFKDQGVRGGGGGGDRHKHGSLLGSSTTSSPFSSSYGSKMRKSKSETRIATPSWLAHSDHTFGRAATANHLSVPLDRNVTITRSDGIGKYAAEREKSFYDSSCFSESKRERRSDEDEISSSVFHSNSNKYVRQGPGVSLSTIQSLRKLLDKRKSMQKDT